MSPHQIALWTVLGVALAISVVTDLSSRRILDWVTLPALALALGLRLWFEGWGGVWEGALSGLLGGALASAVFALLAWRGRMGWGDVKLMAAVGAAFGYPGVVAGVVFITLAGAAQALVTLLWQGAVWETVSGVVRRLAERAHLAPREVEAGPRRQIPYGVAIAVGSIWAMWWQRASGTP